MTEARVKRPALKAAERRAWQSAGNGRRGERTVELPGKMPVVIGLLLCVYAAGQAAVKLYGPWIPKFANIHIDRLTVPYASESRPQLASPPFLLAASREDAPCAQQVSRKKARHPTWP